MGLPNTGDFNWGDSLNDYISNTVEAEAATAEQDITAHKATLDPHGDRAFTTTLINNLTGTIGAANGLAQLGADQRLKATQVPAGGGRSSTYDVVRDFNAKGDGTTDDSAAIQAAVTACSNGGGGEVWFPNGTYAVGTAISITGSNVWIHLSPGATVKRIAPIVAPTNIFTNWVSTSSNGGYNGPGKIMISGGTIDSNGSNITQPCNPVSFVHSDGVYINNVNFTNTIGSSAVLLAGCTNVFIDECKFLGYIVGNANATIPAIAIEFANGNVIPGTGQYDNTPCTSVFLHRTKTAAYQSLGGFGSLVGSTFPIANLVHQRISVTSCAMENTASYAVSAVGWDNVQVTNNQLFSCNGGVLWKVPTNHITNNLMTNCVIQGNLFNNSGVVNQSNTLVESVIFLTGIYSGGASPTSVAPVGAVVSNNSFVGSRTTSFIYGLNVDNLDISGNAARSGTGAGTAGAIYILQCQGASVTGNKISSVPGNGILLSAVDNNNIKNGSSNSAIVGNTISAAGISAINVLFSTRVSVTGNTVYSTPGAATTASILFQGSSDYCICQGNTVDKYITATTSVNHGLHNDMTRFATANVANITGTST